MSNDNHTRETGAKKVLRLLLQSGELFRDRQGRAYGTFQLSGRLRTVMLDTKEFRSWLTSFFLTQLKSALAATECDAIIDALTQKAQSAPQREIFVRVGHDSGNLVLDLCRDDGQVVLVESCIWRIVPTCVPKFIRPRGMLALPLPATRHSNLRTELEPFFGSNRRDMALVCGYLVGLLNPTFPQPVLEIIGPQGSGKSSRAKVIRSSVDPNFAPIRRPPRSERDLFISAGRSWILCLENISSIPPWLSDALCSIATGGGYATRKLWEDEDEILFDVRRSVVVNGIHEVITRPDLRDRALSIRAEQISPSQRKTEEEFRNIFAESHPRILGAIADCASTALHLKDALRPPQLPRLADWYQFVLAAAEDPAFGFSPHEFEEAFAANREEGRQHSIDASAVGSELLILIQDQGPWHGTMKDLLENLNARASETQQRAQEWPKSPERLRHAIERIAPDLKIAGLTITSSRSPDKSHSRLISLEFSREMSE